MKFYLILGTVSCLIGIAIFATGFAIMTKYPYPKEYDKYHLYNCTIHDHTIGTLHFCLVDGQVQTKHMTVWNISTSSRNSISMISRPYSSPPPNNNNNNITDEKVLCMCDLNYVAPYPILDDDNELDCTVWKACMMDVDYIFKLQQDSRFYLHVGLILVYIGVFLNSMALIMSLGVIINRLIFDLHRNRHITNTFSQL